MEEKKEKWTVDQLVLIFVCVTHFTEVFHFYQIQNAAFASDFIIDLSQSPIIILQYPTTSFGKSHSFLSSGQSINDEQQNKRRKDENNYPRQRS